ncbi:MAG: erythromycin esterase family protein [Planctomycetota bacterium]
MNEIRLKIVVPLLTLGIAVSGVGSADVHAKLDDDHVSGKDFIGWVRENAIRLDTLDWRSADLTRLSVLDRLLEEKRIVFLAEPDHYVREKYDFQLIFIRYLFERGWRHIGMEMGRADGRRIDRYLATGDMAWLERVASYGYKGDERANRKDIPNGLVPKKSDRDFVKNIHDEQYWFQKQLRSLNETLPPGKPRLRWFGFDADLRPGGAYVDAEGLLKPHESDPLVRKILKRLARPEVEPRPDEIKRLENLLRLLEREETGVRRLLGKEDAVELGRTLRCLTDGLAFIEAGRKGPMSDEWLPAMRQREETMFRQMDDVLKDLPPDEKIILLGAFMHLSKNSDALQFGAKDDPFASPMWPSIGNYLDKKLPGKVYSIWMLYDHGRHGVPMLAEPIEEVRSDRYTVEYLFAKAGTRYFLPFQTGDHRESYLDRVRNFRPNGGSGAGLLKTHTDAIFFVAEAHEPGWQRPADS